MEFGAENPPLPENPPFFKNLRFSQNLEFREIWGFWALGASGGQKIYYFLVHKSDGFQRKYVYESQNFRACGALKMEGLDCISECEAVQKRNAGARKMYDFGRFLQGKMLS